MLTTAPAVLPYCAENAFVCTLNSCSVSGEGMYEGWLKPITSWDDPSSMIELATFLPPLAEKAIAEIEPLPFVEFRKFLVVLIPGVSPISCKTLRPFSGRDSAVRELTTSPKSEVAVSSNGASAVISTVSVMSPTSKGTLISATWAT